MNPIDIACPRCRAAPGQKCRDYRGKGKAPCKDRQKRADPQAEHWRQAALKTKRERAKVQQQVPLFADQVQTRSVEENYWRTRFMVAGIMEDSEPRAGFHADWTVYVLKQIARRTVPADAYAMLEAQRWKGDEVMFWKDVLSTTRRIVLRYERLVYLGPLRFVTSSGREVFKDEHVEIREAEVWPPEGWTPPYTRDQLNAMLSIPPPADFAGAVDPMQLNAAK